MSKRTQREEGFVTQLLTGDYRSFSEDRLTQLAAACFNHSIVFRRCFLEFLGVRDFRNPTNIVAQTQWPVWRNNEERGRLDLVLLRNGRVVAIVENKVDSPLYAKQLRFYSSVAELRSARKVALVRHYFELNGVGSEWRLLHWRDFYMVLQGCHEKGKPISLMDGFTINNFIQYLEAANMHIPTKISKKDMSELARMLHGLRYASETKFKWIPARDTVFQTAADWIRMMESIFDESRLVPKLTKAAKKKYRFKPNISHWWDDDGDVKTYPWVGVDWQIWFPKPKGKTRSIGLGLFVNEDGKWNIDAFRNVKGSKTIESKEIVNGRHDVVLAKLSKAVLKKWQQWLP